MSVQDVLRDVRDPLVVMQRVVKQALVLIPAADGAVVELLDGGELTYVRAAGTLEPHVGTRLNVVASFSGQAMSARTTLHCTDATTDPRVNREACVRVGAVSMICVPLDQRSQPVGVLKVSASRRHAFVDRDVSTLSALAEFISAMIGSAFDLARIVADVSMPPPCSDRWTDFSGSSATAELSRGWQSDVSEFMVNVLDPDASRDVEETQRIRGVLAESNFSTVYQPIVELANRTLVGSEALTRFPRPEIFGPDVWFADAHHVGLGIELELAAVAQALANIDELPDSTFLAINVGPQALATSELPRLLAGGDARRVVIELTEHEGNPDYPGLRASLSWIRTLGVRLAIDDTGSGFATLTHIVNLAPDIIKLDREIVADIDIDPVRRSLVGALVDFAGATGATITAEGIETDDELEVVADLGIQCAQGYLLGHPGTIAELHAPSSWRGNHRSRVSTSRAGETLGRAGDRDQGNGRCA